MHVNSLTEVVLPMKISLKKMWHIVTDKLNCFRLSTYLCFVFLIHYLHSHHKPGFQWCCLHTLITSSSGSERFGHNGFPFCIWGGSEEVDGFVKMTFPFAFEFLDIGFTDLTALRIYTTCVVLGLSSSLAVVHFNVIWIVPAMSVCAVNPINSPHRTSSTMELL